MNKSALRSFASNARRELLDKVKAKAMKIGITEEKIKKADVEGSDAIFIDGRQLSSEEQVQRKNLIKRIDQKGFNQVMEEVAYTWFNRFTALRFMEVNEYLPTNVRVLSSGNPEDPIPDIIKEAMSLDLDIDKEFVYERKVKNENDKLFQYLIIKQCNDLYDYLPFMFEKIDDYTEILFPEGLLSKDSFLRQMTNVEVIPEENWLNVEIIGWLYQYYIAEEKDRVIHAKKKYKTEEIPYATQLFTPDWIVRYMVQNSLGRYWIENHPEDRELIENWEFYLDNSNPEPNFEEKIAPYLDKKLNVEEIKCFDPAMGSGHILIYMFDVLYELYSKYGYLERDIPRLIIENNLYGLDIDDRAYQLACFSVVMKAMQYNKRFLRGIKRHGLELNLVSIQETNEINDSDIKYLAREDGDLNYKITSDFLNEFKDAKVYGSLIKVQKYDMKFLKERINYIQSNPANDIFEEESRAKLINLLPTLFKQHEIMEREYDILITNPPYMGSKYMNATLSQFIKTNYPDAKSDTFSAFMEQCTEKTKKLGHLGMVTPFVWMFINAYKNIRETVVNFKNISTLIQLEYNAFSEAVVPVCTFTLRNYNVNLSGEYIRLSDFTGSENQPIKVLEAIKNPDVYYRYSSYTNDYGKIKDSPIAYWASRKERDAFASNPPISEFGDAREGMATANNNYFLRQWYEVDFDSIGFGYKDRESAKNSKLKWFPYNKGGSFRRWFGNTNYIVNWFNDGYEIRNYKDEKTGRIRSHNYNLDYIFQKAITWSSISSSKFSCRYSETGRLSDSKGPSLYLKDDQMIYYVLGFLNSKVAQKFLDITASTIDYKVGDIADLPLKVDDEYFDLITEKVNQCTKLSKDNWDSYETSIDFKMHPILKYKADSMVISQAYQNWEKVAEDRYYELKKSEEELNKIFFEIYELQNEMSPTVDNEDVSITVANRERDIKSFLSYAIGCMTGRYSLDQEGLTYTGGEFYSSKHLTFNADEDNILPILKGAYFEDDIVSRFVDFVKVTFGEETLEENLDFIADTLGKKKNETAKEAIGRYFLNDFFKDHVQTYKKRPIYWLFTSGKQKAFNCFIYMHRYDSTTLGRIRTDYLHELQTRMEAEKESLVNIIDGDSTSKEINQAKKELKSLEKKIEELKEYDEVLHHLADQQIEIDLDDGVEVNYEKFKGLLAKK